MTTLTKISIAEASPAQLRYYANVILGLEDIKKGTSAANIGFDGTQGGSQ